MKILITGATSGIGRSVAIALSREGHELALCGRSHTKMGSLLELLSCEPKLARTFCITKTNDIFDFVTDTNALMSGVDVLINCAGLNSARSDVVDLDIDALDYMYKVNFRAPTIFTKLALAIMIKQNEGRIINIHSTACLFSNPGISAYTATKSGFDALSKVCRKEAIIHNIGVVNIYPGGVNTNFREKTVAGYMDPNSVANAVISLMKLPNDVIPHEFVIRPQAEKNYA